MGQTDKTPSKPKPAEIRGDFSIEKLTLIVTTDNSLGPNYEAIDYIIDSIPSEVTLIGHDSERLKVISE
jgi:nucleoside diphosphate kinase